MSATCRRRSIVTALERRGVPVTVDQLVDAVVDDDASMEEWCDVHEELSVVDLPVLDATGVLEYDPDAGVIDLPTDEREPPVPNRSPARTAIRS